MEFLQRVRFWFSSLRIRLLILIVCVGVLPCLFLSVAFLEYAKYRMVSNDAIRLTAQAQVVNNDLISSGYLKGNNSESINTELVTLANSYSGRIMVMDAGLRIMKDTYDMHAGRTLIFEQAVRSLSNSTERTFDEKNNFLVLTVPIIAYDEPDTILGVLLLSKSTDDIVRSMDYFRSLAIVIDLSVAAASVAVAVYLSSRMTQPLLRIATGISDITKGIKQDSLLVDNYTETQAISDSFTAFHNQMTVVDDSRAEFVSNVSHELKTPLTSMKVLADSILMMGNDAPIEMYREFMGDITSEIDHENNIINELLTLVRQDKAKKELNISPVNMNDLLEILLKRLQPIAAQAKVELVMESFRPVTAEVDELQFSLAIMNLIENAIKYNNEGGWVHVSLNSDHQYCFIRVEDNGLGIPEDSVDRIFERFYRADKSHSRQISGTGLGLAITHEAIVMHHGEIAVRSTEGEGTTFDVRLPLKYIKEAV
ncbi:MAG: ATP-binding protein [Lachnospiraceae bacterium]|nr:ATP-binding protein [Lachnospiraceae bacterium]